MASHLEQEHRGVFLTPRKERVECPERGVPRRVEWATMLVMPFVYIIKNLAHDLYVGVSKNPQQRLIEHNSQRGADFTRRGSNYRIVFLEEHPTLADARKREIQIKKWRRGKKEMLIEKYQKGLPNCFR